MFHWIKVVWNIWPELMALIHHVKEQLPSEQHVAAVKHVLRESKALVRLQTADTIAKQIEVPEFISSLSNLESFEDE